MSSIANKYLDLQCSPTWSLADVEHITDDVLSVLIRLPPGHLDVGGWEGFGLHVGGHTRQSISPENCEAGTGLRGAGAVLSDTLVDSLVILADTIYRQCAVRGAGKKRWNRKERKWEWKWGRLVSLTAIWNKRVDCVWLYVRNLKSKSKSSIPLLNSW